MMTYYGLGSRLVNETIELYDSREQAEDVVRTVLELAPGLADDICVVEIELEEPNPN